MMTNDRRVILFDAGGTLLRVHPSVGEIYGEVAGRYGCRVSAERLNHLFYEVWHQRDGRMLASRPLTEKIEREWWRSLVREIFSRVGGVNEFEAFFTELYDRFGRAESWRLYPEVPGVLVKLREQGKRLLIVSNWDSRLFEICRGLRLTDYFEDVIASAVIGTAKPGPGIFQEALDRAGCRPQEALHVGDSFEDDVRGARAAGLEAVLIDRNPQQGRPAREFRERVRVIYCLEELLE